VQAAVWEGGCRVAERSDGGSRSSLTAADWSFLDTAVRLGRLDFGKSMAFRLLGDDHDCIYLFVGAISIGFTQSVFFFCLSPQYRLTRGAWSSPPQGCHACADVQINTTTRRIATLLTVVETIQRSSSSDQHIFQN